MGLVIAVVGIAVLGGLAVVVGWFAAGEAECANAARHPKAGAPAYCRLPRGHAGGHRYGRGLDHFES
jgi:hypothetical protein